MNLAQKIFAVALLFVLSLGVAHGDAGKSGCVSWKSEARFVGLAYNHLVHLKSACKAEVTCEVSTDVNPKVQKVKLKPEAKKTVTTFIGSPAREFKATVLCK